jgi:predicted enzyme related to lactoylglutathione lyase
VEAAEFILYVAGQARAKAFYRHVLTAEPALDVPGMTEFSLGGATLGLMPAADMEDLLAGQIRGGTGQRCELYLRRADAAAALGRAADGGGKLLDGLRTGRRASAWLRAGPGTATSWPSRCPPGRPARWSGPGSIGART